MKYFNTYDKHKDFKPCMKRPIQIQAVQINELFIVATFEGLQAGKVGDYLMQGIEGELYICDQKIFKKTYDFIKD